ncbi:PREDICTED: uncharacterized protein LOC106557308 [Thamnophis sirtalis]|uniref:Uncharacterized protein LOC106557308 n=1 Tax=Thamnophis sirtalis TaxID=35019 RepID=A0A6I9Z890_9SAUR|nr:PREDICTED: uncharacterized protein LOC106557308 [Thamnophis sirtalis]
MAPKSKLGRRPFSNTSQAFATKLQPLSSTPPTGDLLTKEFLFETLKEFREEMKQLITDLCDKLDTKIAQTKEDMVGLVTVLTDYVAGMEDKLELLEEANTNLTSKIEVLQQKVENAEKQLVMTNYKKMELALRVRGLRENDQENLKLTFSEALNRLVGSPGLNFDWQIQKIYRHNSWTAKQKQLPRDVVIYFATKESRNAILQELYNNRLRIDGQDLIVFKEMPPQMLRARRDYVFLTKELRNNQIQYRWEVPFGITVTLDDQKHRLNSPCEARDFYNKILKAGPLELPGLVQRQGEVEERQPITQLQGGRCCFSPPEGRRNRE